MHPDVVWKSIRSLSALRPAEGLPLLLALLAGSWSPSIAFFAGHRLWIIPIVYLIPAAVAAWVVWRRVQYVERKRRFAMGENVCLDCGYDIGDVARNRPETSVCPECGSPVADREFRAHITLPESFVFPGLERAGSDQRAREWLRAAHERGGWAGKHRLLALALLLLGIGCFYSALLHAVSVFVDPPEWLKWAWASLIGASWIAGIWFFEQRWFRNMTAAIESFDQELSPSSDSPAA